MTDNLTKIEFAVLDDDGTWYTDVVYDVPATAAADPALWYMLYGPGSRSLGAVMAAVYATGGDIEDYDGPDDEDAED